MISGRAIAIGLFTSGILFVEGGGAQSISVSGWVRNGGTPMKDAAVYLVPLDSSVAAPVEPRVIVDQVHLAFVPSLVVVTPGSEVSFVNGDALLHNVFSPGADGVAEFDLGTYDQSVARSRVFVTEGLHVILCHIHPDMAAYVIVARTPFKAITKEDGGFAIEGVPSGRYSLRAWHARRWRDETVREVIVPESGLAGIGITLGRSGERRTP